MARNRRVNQHRPQEAFYVSMTLKQMASDSVSMASRAPVAISGISAHYSQWAPFDGLAFRAPQMLEYDATAWKNDAQWHEIDLGKALWLNGIVYSSRRA